MDSTTWKLSLPDPFDSSSLLQYNTAGKCHQCLPNTTRHFCHQQSLVLHRSAMPTLCSIPLFPRLSDPNHCTKPCINNLNPHSSLHFLDACLHRSFRLSNSIHILLISCLCHCKHHTFLELR